MPFNFTDSWNPANDTKQSPWGSYARRFAGDKYGDLSKDFNSESDINIDQGKKTKSGDNLTTIHGDPSKVLEGGGGGGAPWGQIISAAASIGMGALSGGFSGGGGGGGGGGGANFSSAGAAPTGISWGDAVNYKV